MPSALARARAVLLALIAVLSGLLAEAAAGVGVGAAAAATFAAGGCAAQET
jgi:hypothetical protein